MSRITERVSSSSTKSARTAFIAALSKLGLLLRPHEQPRDHASNNGRYQTKETIRQVEHSPTPRSLLRAAASYHVVARTGDGGKTEANGDRY